MQQHNRLLTGSVLLAEFLDSARPVELPTKENGITRGVSRTKQGVEKEALW
jgi:hypothetical protein